MSEQIALTIPAGKTDAPRCRMCPLPASKIRRRDNSLIWGNYCGGGSCTNRERICQHCQTPFIVNANGAGTKYCSTVCKNNRGQNLYSKKLFCAWCQKPTWSSRKYERRSWPYICTECLTPLKHVLAALQKHHVPHEMARKLSRDGSCEICGRDVLTPAKGQRNGRMRPLLAVDHDHVCCPGGSYSCGQCVRGLLCVHCNSAEGLLDGDPVRARSLAQYLDRWANRT